MEVSPLVGKVSVIVLPGTMSPDVDWHDLSEFICTNCFHTLDSEEHYPQITEQIGGSKDNSDPRLWLTLAINLVRSRVDNNSNLGIVWWLIGETHLGC